ncbi:MAG: DUF6049 family protein [Nocardioidaceae bacterium]
MSRATRAISGLAVCLAVSATSAPHSPARASAPPDRARSTVSAGVSQSPPAPPGSPSRSAPRGFAGTGDLVVAIERLRSVSLRRGQPLVVHGTVTNTSSARLSTVQAYLQLSPEPATTLRGLADFARVAEDTGLGNPDLTDGEYAKLGTVLPGQSRDFVIRVPFRHLEISGAPGVYRLGVKVLSTTPDGIRDPADAARTNTLLPLLPARRPLAPVQTLTLLPLSAPVTRLTGGKLADDSLVRLLTAGGRLSNVVAWALTAAPDTVQVVIDPALLTAVRDMSNGYRIAGRSPTSTAVRGRGYAAAAQWLADFRRLNAQQHVMLLPWGGPAADSLLGNRLPGPVVAAIKSSSAFQSNAAVGSGVAGWLPEGRSGARAVSVMRRAGASLQILSQSNLPALRPDERSSRPPPSRLDVMVARQRVPTLVVATRLAGFQTTADTSPLQFRQRLLAEATARSLSQQTQRVAVTALPFGWDPGPPVAGQDLAAAFTMPVIVAQSALGALDRAGRRYDGDVRPAPGSSGGLPAAVIVAIRDLGLAGGNLAAILSPSDVAQQAFQRAFAMSGSAQWIDFPRTGAELVSQLATADHEALAKVTVTGPPFVAMSSDSGRFPLTVTNGLDEPVSVGLAVTPENPALSIAPLPTITLPAGQRRDVQVVSTADGSGVTSVRARLATLTGRQFGGSWRFDVRATQIGLVIWVVMGIGGLVLFSAAGYRIVGRLRGNGVSRRQTST